MDRLAICRICLNANVSYLIPNTQVKEVYEKLTSISFQNAMKPSLICHICHAQLENAHRLMMKCLKAEDIVMQMLNQLVASKDQVHQESIHIDGIEFTQLICTAVQHIDIEPLSNVNERLRFTFEEDLVDVKMEVETEEGASIANKSKLEAQTNNTKVNKSKDNTDSKQSTVTPNHEVTTSMCSVKTETSTIWEGTTDKDKHDTYDGVSKSENKYQWSDSFEIQCKEEYIAETLIGNESNIIDEDRDNNKNVNLIISNETISNAIIIENCDQNITSSYLCDRKSDTDDFKQSKISQNNNTDCESSTKDSHLVTSSKNEAQFICDICRRKYSCESELKIHVCTHNGEGPYICNKRLKKINNLKRNERKHTGERPYSCKMCDKTFRVIGNLKIHERIHTNDRPYICKICNRSFKQISHLKSHESTHTGERPYSCKICNKRFTRIDILKIHERIHTGNRPYICKICNNTFTQMSHLKCHERIHTGERPYSCKICNKRFTQKNYIKRHERIHTGERPTQL